MSRVQKLFLHLSNLAVCGTGLVYAWMRYLVEPGDEWAVVNHPWQPHFQHLHVLTAPLLVFALGLIWSTHVLGKLANGSENRVAGAGLTALFLPMVASGYLLQVAVDPGVAADLGLGPHCQFIAVGRGFCSPSDPGGDDEDR